MPELPEVETIVRGLQKTIIDKKITHVEVFKTKQLTNSTVLQFQNFLNNESIAQVKRFGKYIHFIFKSQKSLVVHLRMTGKFIRMASDQPGETKYVRLIFHLHDNSLLLFQDLRIFGTFSIYQPGEFIREKNKVGLDPFSPRLTSAWLIEKMQKRKIAIKVFLLDQSVITGIGNIYACEALFDAQIDPLLPANQVTANMADQLIKSIRLILKKAIRLNGTSVSDYRTVEDKTGQFQNTLNVYQKEHSLCRVCRQAKIIRIKQAQRSTFYCPTCQK